MPREANATRRGIRVFSAVWLSTSIVVAGVAAIAVLHEQEVLPPRFERLYLRWFMTSGELADRGRSLRLSGDTDGARKLFEEALKRDQASPYRWSDYAEALLASGDGLNARRCMERAIELGQHVGPVRMRAVNLAYLTGDAGWALKEGLTLVGMTEEYDSAVFGVWDRMELDSSIVLRSELPDPRSAQAYVRYLLRAKRVQDLESAWLWAERKGYSEDRLADDCAAFLVYAGEREKAARIWTEHAANREPGYPRENLIFNGGFEREPIGSVFDWAIEPVEGVRAQRQSGISADGQWALRLDFDHTQNIEYEAVSQNTLVNSGRWRFEGRLRTQDVTTDQGIGFRILDADSPRRLMVNTKRLTGTNDWTALTVEFVVHAPATLLTIQVVRSPSLKFDNLLGGSAWIDGVRLGRAN